MNTKGFTLIELLIVIAIIGILTTITGSAVSSARRKAQTASAQSNLLNIEKAIFQMALDTNAWPNHQSVNCVQTGGSNEVSNLNTGPAGLVINDSGNPYAGWAGPYMTSVPVDPWGAHYFLDTDYYVTSADLPCGQNGGTSGCTGVVAVGSLGPNNDGGINDYDSDNIIKIIARGASCL